MANAPPERQWLLHSVYVTLYRNAYVRNHASHITGKIMILCKHIDLKKIMLQYPGVASYHVMKVEDTTTGEEFPELRTGIIQNIKEE